jgi:hypothetical protein
MSSTDELDDGVDAREPAPDTEVGDARFEGDTGQLPIDTRRVLVQLLLGPSLDARRQNRLWPVLLRDETVVRSRLHELFLELIIDRDLEVAFTRQVASAELEVPILLRKAGLTFLESVLLIFLRQRLTQAETQGERAVVSRDDMLAHLQVFESAGNPDHARFEKQQQNAVEKAKKLSLIRVIRSSEGRYEVSPTLKLLFSAEEVQSLTAAYQSIGPMGSGAAYGSDSDSEGDDA